MTTSIPAPITFDLPISATCVWQAGEPLDVAFVDAALRRRLSPLAKMFLHVAKGASQGVDKARVVYASEHGDLSRTSSMLLDLAKQQPLSPTTFNMAVHNANPGIWSILNKDTSAHTALCADDSTLGWGMLEAAMQWQQNPRSPVLLVYADEPVPALFGGEDSAAAPAVALALLMGDETTTCHLSVTAHSTPEVPPSSFSFPRALAKQLQTGGQWQGSTHLWSWKCRT
jgi:hypothetical protein